MERVYDVVEAEAHCRVSECFILNRAAVPGRAGIEELPRRGRDLLRGTLQVTADGFGIGKCEVVETDQVAGSSTGTEQCFTQREFEGRCVPSEQDDRSPLIFDRGFDAEKFVHFDVSS